MLVMIDTKIEGHCENFAHSQKPCEPDWILAIFISTSHPDASYEFSNQLALWFRKKSEKKSFKMAAMTAILDFRSKQFKLF